MDRITNGYIYEELIDNKDNLIELENIIKLMNENYPIPLIEKINIKDYSKKILNNGHVIVCKRDTEIVGFVTFYANKHKEKEAAFSLLGVLKPYRGFDIATTLFELSFEIMKSKGMKTVFSFTHKNNLAAIKFHSKLNFYEEPTIVTNQDYNISLIKTL